MPYPVSQSGWAEKWPPAGDEMLVAAYWRAVPETGMTLCSPTGTAIFLALALQEDAPFSFREIFTALTPSDNEAVIYREKRFALVWFAAPSDMAADSLGAKIVHQLPGSTLTHAHAANRFPADSFPQPANVHAAGLLPVNTSLIVS